MFCYQCEQTAKGSGCTAGGVCGKDPETAAMQDLLAYAVKDIARYVHRARQHGASDADIDAFIPAALFACVTNVDFDPERLQCQVAEAARLRDKAVRLYEDACRDAGAAPEKLETRVAWWAETEDLQTMIDTGRQVTIRNRIDAYGDDIAGLQELTLYGLKGAAAYADHARILGVADDKLFGDFHAMLSDLADEPTDAQELTGKALAAGEINLRAMELLDKANTGSYGHPEPTQARVTPVAGKCICVSGHDLKDLGDLLEQTRGTGINVYTHGEMLPCLAYPELKKYDHLVGNYGGAWQDQRKEFDEFPGAILMTTNCIQKPKDSYKDRIFTTGLVAFPGVTHIDEDADGAKDFTPVVEAAQAAPGFAEDADEKRIPCGFAHNAVMGVADQVVEAVKGGDIRHFFLIGGCDGAKTGRNYYTEFAQSVPDDCVILTLACGKYRFNKLDFGEIGGIPRLLDMGQCNDAYSAVKVAQALADAFGCGVNELPLSLILSWYEQKAVAILLTLLHLGIKDMRLGPSLPAFVAPNVLNVLVEKFDLKPIATPAEDLKAILG
ncbi:MAG: hydroxylamine reductase [Planctomycetota bacterium]